MKIYLHYLFILACLIATYFLYNKQLGSIPLLLLAVYLLIVSIKEFYKMKNK